MTDDDNISAYDIAMEVYNKLWNDNNGMTEKERFDTAFRWLMVEDNDWQNPMTGLNAMLELVDIMARKHKQPA